MVIYKIWTKAVINQPVKARNSYLVLGIIKISCVNRIKAKPKVINVMAHLENRLSTYLYYAIIKTQIANLGKLTALSEKAVSLMSSNYSPYSKV